MEPARIELAEAIHSTVINTPVCPIYQNATAQPVTDPEKIKENLVAQLTAPVLWTQITRNMIADGGTLFTEVGPGSVLQGLISKIGGENVKVEGV
jgi:[acyl-carrier-protein] S-malonyltransferase